MSRVREWLRDLFVGRPDPATKALNAEVIVQSERLNDATENLVQKIDGIRKERHRNRTSLAAMLDETLSIVSREKKR